MYFGACTPKPSNFSFENRSYHLSTSITACGFRCCSSLLMLEIFSKVAQVSGRPQNSPVSALKPTWNVCSKFVGGLMTGLSLTRWSALFLLFLPDALSCLDAHFLCAFASVSFASDGSLGNGFWFTGQWFSLDWLWNWMLYWLSSWLESGCWLFSGWLGSWGSGGCWLGFLRWKLTGRFVVVSLSWFSWFKWCSWYNCAFGVAGWFCEDRRSGGGGGLSSFNEDISSIVWDTKPH